MIVITTKSSDEGKTPANSGTGPFHNSFFRSPQIDFTEFLERRSCH